MTEQPKANISIKALIISGMIILLLVPTLMIRILVKERQDRQKEAIKEISAKWADAQTITGPIISIPYLEYSKDANENVIKTKKYLHILPDQLTIDGIINPEKRYRGIFETMVYRSSLNFNGYFSNLLVKDTSIPIENILYDQAFISVGITDLRGISENLILNWDNKPITFNSGIETNDILKSGINSSVKINKTDTINKVHYFSFKLDIKGSQNIYFTPIGKETLVNMSSSFDSPSFSGAFLPDTREISKKGFSANWKVLHLNRNYPQSWLNKTYSVDNSSFGLDLILPLNNYSKTDRSIKYAILFIALTFLIFFFLELLNNKSIHPLQYALIGFALCVFYILLLSISEHINYNFAYLIASIMTIGLIWWYSRSILGEKRLSSLIGVNLIILYGFIFTIIQLQDFALLLGSLGLFTILAIVMYYSRKINWINLAK